MIALGGFIGLAALMIGLFTWLRQDIAGIESKLGKRIDAVERGQAELRERMAKLTGLREAITGRRAAS